MVYSGLADAYRDFMGVYVRPACCGLFHWGPDELMHWLRMKTPWDGEWKHLSPALVIRASIASRDAPCPASNQSFLRD